MLRTLTWLAASSSSFFFFSPHISGAHAKLNCPLYGLGYPKPENLFAYEGISNAARALDGVFAEYIDSANGTGSDRFSYSVQVFAAGEDAPLWTHHWTATNLATMNTTGVRKIDGDTVYRMGSLTKIFTMLTFLSEVGDAAWNEPIAKFIPEIEAMVAAEDGTDTSHSLTSPDWGSITIGALASQISGLMRDYSLLGELTQTSNMTQTVAIGLPALADTDIPPCGNAPVCNRTQFFEGLRKLPPSFAPFVTPAYSDIGYVLLGYALEKMTGKPFQQSFEEKLVKPLNLTHTFYKTPNDSLGVIPGGRLLTTWAFNMGNESPTGNIYASTNDLSSVGRAILRSTLLPPPLTRRWLRPVTFSSDPASSVGSPWGVRRLPLPSSSSPQNNKTSAYQFATTYNKLGSIGKYSALLALIPDFDIGFAVLAAGDVPAPLVLSVADTLSDTYLPTLRGAARVFANRTYAGRYVSADGAVNSSLVVAVDNDNDNDDEEGGGQEKPGLAVTEWISNGTSLMGLVVALGQNISREYWERMRPSVRLYPSGLWDALPESGGRRVGFKATFEDLNGTAAEGKPFTTDCSTWVGVAGVVYGSQPLDGFVFELDANGSAVAVENVALRNRMVKVSS